MCVDVSYGEREKERELGLSGSSKCRRVIAEVVLVLLLVVVTMVAMKLVVPFLRLIKAVVTYREAERQTVNWCCRQC